MREIKRLEAAQGAAWLLWEPRAELSMPGGRPGHRKRFSSPGPWASRSLPQLLRRSVHGAGTLQWELHQEPTAQPGTFSKNWLMQSLAFKPFKNENSKLETTDQFSFGKHQLLLITVSVVEYNVLRQMNDCPSQNFYGVFTKLWNVKAKHTPSACSCSLSNSLKELVVASPVYFLFS